MLGAIMLARTPSHSGSPASLPRGTRGPGTRAAHGG